MRLFLVRHGQSKGNVDKSEYFKYPDSEIALTEKGKTDATGAANFIYNYLHKLHLERDYPNDELERFGVVHSTYLRATQTANIVVDTINEKIGYSVENVKPSPLCREREWGTLRDIIESNMKTENHFNFYYRPVGGESFADAYLRAAIFHQWLLDNVTYYNNVIVAHGEFNKVYLMHLLNWTPEEFAKVAGPHNGEVWLVENGQLSSLTPLRESTHYRKSKL